VSRQCHHFLGYGRWDDAGAKTKLREDIKNNVHKNIKPNQLRQSKIEAYGEFPLGVFRKHIYQEEYAQTGRSYWLQKKDEKKKKDEEKTKPSSRPTLE
jgi:hypothetical protein